ncbi:TPA: hypothetical protein P0E36_004923 [Vibrio harveyi]|nr:hypothetical protein [Vibrio harveyi]
MTVINLFTFRGERPKVAPRRLGNEFATKAQDCEYPIGYLQPYQAPKKTGEAIQPLIRTIYRYEDRVWLRWSSDVDVVLSPIDGDPWGRVYFTGETNTSGALQPPQVLINTKIPANGDPFGAYPLGVPAGKTAIKGRVFDPTPLPAKDDKSDDETRFYIYTFATDQGEESAASPASNQLEIKYPSSKVELTIPQIANLSGNITKRRIYRSAESGSRADWYLVAELPISQLKYTDSLTDSQLGRTLESDYYEMPNKKMVNLTRMPNGILAGSWENNVAFCEPYIPHAWPSEYRLTTESDIVAMASVNNVLVVGTKGYPEIFQGISPDAMSGRRLNSEQACVSKRSMLNVDDMIIYASPMGLVGFTGQDVSLLTSEIISTSFWESLEPETIEAYYYDSKYLAFYGTKHDKAFIFDPRVGDLTFVNLGSNFGYTDLQTNTFYMQSQDKAEIATWKKGDDLDYTWRSKEFFGLSPSFDTLHIVAEKPNLVGARVMVDGSVIHDYKPGIFNNRPLRIPAVRGDVWQIEFYGTGTIKQASLATSVAEIWAQ